MMPTNSVCLFYMCKALIFIGSINIVNQLLFALVMVDFSDEEGYGKYLDLHEAYDKYINIKGIEVYNYRNMNVKYLV